MVYVSGSNIYLKYNIRLYTLRLNLYDIVNLSSIYQTIYTFFVYSSVYNYVTSFVYRLGLGSSYGATIGF